VFHYFPHNVKAITFEEAERIVNQILETMEEAYLKLKFQIPASREQLSPRSSTK